MMTTNNMLNPPCPCVDTHAWDTKGGDTQGMMKLANTSLKFTLLFETPLMQLITMSPHET